MTDYERGRQDERAAVVAWLRKNRDAITLETLGSKYPDGMFDAYDDAACDIENRHHLPRDGTNLAPETPSA